MRKHIHGHKHPDPTERRQQKERKLRNKDRKTVGISGAAGAQDRGGEGGGGVNSSGPLPGSIEGYGAAAAPYPSEEGRQQTDAHVESCCILPSVTGNLLSYAPISGAMFVPSTDLPCAKRAYTAVGYAFFYPLQMSWASPSPSPSSPPPTSS